MALINKIRQRSGLAIGVVAFGLGLFIVGGDILGPNSAIMGKNKTDVGEISGKTIDIKEYQDEIDRIKYRYTVNYQRTPTENEMITVRQQAWDYLIVKYAFQEQYDDLGLTVTDDEQWDMIQGKNVRWEIQQSFTDPQTGTFRRDDVIRFLQSVKNAPPNQQASWYLFEEELKPSRLRIKYDNMLMKGLYTTDAEAKRQYDFDNTVAEIRYLYIPYYSVSDSLVEVKDSELKDYLQKHSQEYQVEESRDFSYVTIPIVPSGKDTAVFMEEMDELVSDFKQSKEDSLFARINSDGANFYNSYTIDQLPPMLQANYANLSEGDVRGPYLENGSYFIYKVSGIVEDTAFAAKASHILIKWTDPSDNSKAEAKAKARGLLNQLRSGSDFAGLAKENSEDGSAQAGGDLGWFGKGQMVAPFEKAVLGAAKPGLINDIIETQFGYHIIWVTETANYSNFKIARINRSIIPSDETRNLAFRAADIFSATAKDYDEFLKSAERDSLEVFSATEIASLDRRFNNISNARNIIQWAYDSDTEVGNVSEVKETEDNYIIAVLTRITEAGDAKFETVRDQLVPKVKNQKKAQIIIEKLTGLEGDLDKKAQEYGQDSRVYSSSDLKYTSNSLPSVGFVPEAIGKAFALKEGETTKPFAQENGVLIIQMVALTRAPEIADYSSYKNQTEQRISGRMSFAAAEAIKDDAGIIDRRFRYF